MRLRPARLSAGAAPPAAPPTAAVPPAGGARHAGPVSPGARRRAPAVSLARHAGLPVAVALAAVLNTKALSQNGYANIFYSAGAQSMLRSLHNFLFVSFDPGGLVSVDKPPLALWLQVASAKLFGFSPLSLLLPEAILGVLSVALLYLLLARRLGAGAATAGALALAVFPSFVAVSRDNGVDPLLLALMLGACALALGACRSGRLRTLLASALLVGLAFNTKTLAAYLVVPGIAAGYLVCAPGSLPRRVVQLLCAGLAMLAVSFAWILFVDATPAAKRPYVGSSTDNSELGLTFGYNGLGRVEGQTGGPNSVIVKPGGYVPARQEQRVDAVARAHHAGEPPPAPGEHAPRGEPRSAPKTVAGREREPIPFGQAPGPLRLFERGLDDQAAWLLPLALFGLLALLALVLLDRQPSAGEPRGPLPREPLPRRPLRRDPRLALAFVLGGWFLVEAVVLSFSKGIVHPYYVSALAPGSAAMAGAGALATVALARAPQRRRRLLALALAACALSTTALVQVVLLHREHYATWLVTPLAAVLAACFCALAAARRLAAPALTLAFLALLVAPGAYAATTWLAPVEGTFPVAGPKAFAGPGGYGVDSRDEAIDRALVDFAATHRPGSRWAILTVAADTAAPMMLMGLPAGGLGGYSGTDPALDGPGLARLVARREARYVLLGGEYSLRGGNRATVAVLHACRELSPTQWRSPVPYPFGLVLFDCAGRERALAAER